MNTVKECKPVVTTVSSRSLYDVGRLHANNSVEDSRYLSKWLENPRNLLFEQNCEYSHITQNRASKFYTINNVKLNYIDLLELVTREYSINLHVNNLHKTRDEFPKFAIDNQKHLTRLFNDNINDYDGNFAKPVIEMCFDSVVRELALLKYNHINLFINNSKIKFTLTFDNNRILMINKSFELDSEDCNVNLISYSFFINKELIVSDIVEIRTLIDGFKKYLES
jgi:hypothetical protein